MSVYAVVVGADPEPEHVLPEVQELYEQARKNAINPSHPTAFGGIQKLYQFYQGRLSIEKIKELLGGMYAHTHHRQIKKPRVKNPYTVFTMRRQIQMDLIEIQKFKQEGLAEHNANVKYLAMAIDAFTKYVTCRPMLNKNAAATLVAVTSICRELNQNAAGKKIKYICIDRGLEFMNESVMQYFDENDIKVINVNTHVKCGIVERVNLTIENLIYRYMTQYQTLKYIDELPNLINTYNHRYHRSIKCTPMEAEDARSHIYVRSNLQKVVAAALRKQKKSKKPLLRKGQHVRMAFKPSRFTRGYHPQTETQIYEIASVIENKVVPMYTVKKLGGERALRKTLYANALIPLKVSEYRIAKVLGRQREEGRELVLCEFAWTNIQEWVPRENIIKIVQPEP